MGPALARHAQHAEAAGITRITVMDHFWQIRGVGPLGRTLNSPQSLQRPHRYLMIGGGEKKTLRLVAQYADACNSGRCSRAFNSPREKRRP